MIWDLPNLLICWTVILAAYLIQKIKPSHALCLGLITCLPYCLNYVLFDPSYMPDQFTYWHMLTSIRDLSYNANYYRGHVTDAAYMYAFLPFPFVETINSLGFFNKFLMILIFIWAYSVLKLRGWILWFLLLYPSLLLYSSLGLREMLICSFMLLALWSLIRGWYVFTLVCIVALVQIKTQNALLIVLFSVGYILDRWFNFNPTKKNLFNLLLIFFTTFYLLFPFIIGKIEYFRSAMYFEDGGIPAEYQPINGFIDFLSKGVQGIFRALLYPLPWSADGFFQQAQSIENLCITGLLCVFTYNSYKLIPKQTLIWLFFLLSSMIMYGLVVNNEGTIARYKVPFILVYLIFLSYERLCFNKRIRTDHSSA